MNRGLVPYKSGPEVRKIKMPLCDGENLIVWLNQAYHCFALHEMNEVSKLRAARICSIGAAEIWLQTEERDHPFKSWGEFKLQLSLWFTEAEPPTPLSPILLHQTGNNG
ncbi:hypothetical protein Scep_018560 [Stephania cephalantha]|uniref:Uncharacterized protein n=1 Tax=Stephania cephalantha TaxID=152367 RepID=A0AAP0NNX2_9MAGN